MAAAYPNISKARIIADTTWRNQFIWKQFVGIHQQSLVWIALNASQSWLHTRVIAIASVAAAQIDVDLNFFSATCVANYCICNTTQIMVTTLYPTI